MSSQAIDATPHGVAVVIPVYRGQDTLQPLVEELSAYANSTRSPAGNEFRVSEIVLVHDCGPDRSDETIRALAGRYALVRPVWLARNFGQHAATLAGMSSATAQWIVTMDEDGQHDPAAIGRMLDTALATQSPLVYADPTNRPPHSVFRNLTSATAHRLGRMLGAGGLGHFHSYRLVLGEVGRGLAAYCGEGVYLDVALTWVVRRFATCPVAMRTERNRGSGYSTRSLASHFWRMVLTSGTRPLRLVALLGACLSVAAVLLLGWILWSKFTQRVPVQGWTSVMVILLITSGTTLLSLGVVAEYLGIAARAAMGKPLYLVVGDPAAGPLGRPGLPVRAPDGDVASPETPTRVEA
jgi:undecaprenyl-phosphate 4-deoxy-4-formamido-L-arabinose transferase